MDVVHGLEALDPGLDQCVLTVGNFDGVHRAHQQLVAQAGLFAANTGGPVVVLTFEPHPLTIVAPKKAPPRLTTLDDKLRILAELGAHMTVVASSEPTLLGLEAERFVEDVLIRRFHPTHIVEGPSFGFGRGRKGTAHLLKEVASRFDCAVHIVEPVSVQIDAGESLMVSSSLIRRLIQEGSARRAMLCLGRPHAVSGTVVAGDRRGQSLGFPTVNVDGIEQLIPGDGVYAGRAAWGGHAFDAAINVGPAPTFGSLHRRVEAHLLGFDGDLYGAEIRLEFVDYLRATEKFDSPDALAEQLRRDVEAIRSSAHSSQPADRRTSHTGRRQ